MAVSLKAKMNVINAVEALILPDTSVRLKLPGVLWQGWENAPLYVPLGEGDIAEEWGHVYYAVRGWDKVEQNALATFPQGDGTLYRPLPVSLEDLQKLRDELADALRELDQVDAEYKAKERAFKEANQPLIETREAISELKKLTEADTRAAAMRLFAVNGDPEQKKLTEGVSAEFFTATAPFEMSEAVQWAIKHAPDLLTLDSKLVDAFALALENQPLLLEAFKSSGCPIKPEQHVRTEIGWKELRGIADFRVNLATALPDDTTPDE